MDMPMTEPSMRKPVGVLLILALIVVWALLVLVVSPYVLTTPWPVQAIFFTIAGVAWIFPLKPLLRWMER
jgi:Protein of unknown function (DUF2842)